MISRVAESCFWFGRYVERAELPLLFALCSVFVFPSLVEGFGMPVLEALKAGASVVASDRVPIPGLSEVAAVVHPRDLAGMARAIENSLRADGQEHEEIAHRARLFADFYSWERAAQRTLQIYREVLEENR